MDIFRKIAQMSSAIPECDSSDDKWYRYHFIRDGGYLAVYAATEKFCCRALISVADFMKGVTPDTATANIWHTHAWQCPLGIKYVEPSHMWHSRIVLTETLIHPDFSVHFDRPSLPLFDNPPRPVSDALYFEASRATYNPVAWGVEKQFPAGLLQRAVKWLHRPVRAVDVGHMVILHNAHGMSVAVVTARK